MIIKFFKRLDIRLIGIFIVIAFLWNTQFVYPLKIFVVFMHEVSHGLAALATGGSIKEIQDCRPRRWTCDHGRRFTFLDTHRGLSWEPDVGRVDSDSCSADASR